MAGDALSKKEVKTSKNKKETKSSKSKASEKSKVKTKVSKPLKKETKAKVSPARKEKKVSKVSKLSKEKKGKKDLQEKEINFKPSSAGKYDLVIVESPSKAKTIKKYLGRGFQVVASNGHIKDLPKSKLGVDVKANFEADIVPISGKKTVLEKIKKYTDSAGKIFLAPDPDREGEAIAFHLAEDIGRKKDIFRVLFNAITKKAVTEAMANPTALDQKKYDSQKARRILDRLVGYKISPILWDKVQRGLSAGRVQSVALRLIVEREEAIHAFKSEPWYSIHVEFAREGKSFEAKYYGEEPNKKTDLLEKEAVEKILKDVQGKKFQVFEVKKRERKQNPTPPFTTSKLQQEAANKLGFSAKKTMMVAQKLYEGMEISGHGLTGLITYMRTDSVRTDASALEEVRGFIKDKYGNGFLPETPIIYKKKGKSKVQDAHEAIRPSSLNFPPSEIESDLEPDAFKLYELIWNKFVSSQMAQAVIDQTTITFEVAQHYFKTTGSIIKFPGFRTVYLEAMLEKSIRRGGQIQDQEQEGEGEGDDEENLSKSSGAQLPDLKEKEILSPTKGPDSLEHWTSPPPRYSDATIVKDLEEKGIGRPSTYASIISNIVDKGYVEKTENRYLPTELGKVVCKMLIDSFPNIMDVGFTAKVEELLDRIEEGEVKWTKVLSDFWVPFEKTLEVAKEEMKNLKKTEIPTGVKCRKCGEGEYHIKWGRNGQFMACSRYPECTSTEDFKKGLDGVYQILPKEYFETFPCPACGKKLVVKKGRYGRFLACEEYPNCKTALPYTIDVPCPECKKGKFTEKKSRYGKIFYGCSNYPECTNAMWAFPVQHECPECQFPVMGKRESKRLGEHLQCPKCKATVSLNEEGLEEKIEKKLMVK